MITGSSNGGLRYILTSVPQMPATSTLSSAESSATLGIGSSRNSVVFGAVRTAASTCSTIHSPLGISRLRRWHNGHANIPSVVTDATTILGATMTDSEPLLRTMTRTQGNNRALKDGTVTPR